MTAAMMFIAAFLMITGAILFITPEEEDDRGYLGAAGNTFDDGVLEYEVTSEDGDIGEVSVIGYVSGLDVYLDSNDGLLEFLPIIYDGVTYTITSIGDSAFLDCASPITRIDLGSVTSIGMYAFQNCNVLEEIIWGDITIIGDDAFRYCYSLELLDFTEFKGTSTGNGAFRECKGLEKIIFGSITTIERFAFIGCVDLKEIEWGSVIFIGEAAFLECMALETLDFSDNDGIYIESGAFNSCSKIKKIISGPAAYIDGYAFANCFELEYADLSEYKGTSIGERVFSLCFRLKYLFLSNSIAEFSEYNLSGEYGMDRLNADILVMPERFDAGMFNSVEQEIRYIGMSGLVAERDQADREKIILTAKSDVKGIIVTDPSTGHAVDVVAVGDNTGNAGVTGPEGSWTFRQTGTTGSYLVTAAYFLMVEVVGGDPECYVKASFGGSPFISLNGPMGIHEFIVPYGMSVVITAEAGEEYELSWEVAPWVNVIDDVCVLNTQDNENVIMIFSSDPEEPAGVPSATIIPSEGIINVVPGAMLKGTGANEGVYFFIFTFMIDVGYDVDTHLVKPEEGRDGTVVFAGTTEGVYTYAVADITTDIIIFITVEEEEEDDGTGGGIGGGEGPGDADPAEENIGDEEGGDRCWKCTLVLIILLTVLAIVSAWALFPVKKNEKDE